MGSLVTEISCTLNLNGHPHTTSTISHSSSSHVIPSSTKPAASTPPTSLLNADKRKTMASPPLPLPPSRPLFPLPLKFLWFGKDNPPMPSDPPQLPFKVEELDPEELANIAPKSCTCFLEFDAHASNAGPISINDIKFPEDTHKIGGQTMTDSSPELKLEECSSSMSTSASDSEKNWISRILQFRLLWNANNPEPKSSRELVESTLLIAAKGANKALKADVLNSSDDGVGDGISDLNCGVCMMETNRERVMHDRQSVSRFLHEVPVAEVQAISKLCVLSNLAYIVPEVQSKDLLKEHHLSLVTSSLIKKEEADAKAALEKSWALANYKQKNNIGGKKRLKIQEETAVLQKALCDASPLNSVSLSSQILLCAEAPPKEAGILDVAPQVHIVNAAKEEKASLEETINVPYSKEDTLKVQSNCPCEWFICDDEASSTRYLAIQGSDSLASWQTNLSFDPTEFEGLGVLVHRGIYEAAQGLYKMVEKEIVEHTRKGSHARVSFTGHSLGGSLATLLAIMMVKRGVVRASAVEGVVTLGAACVLCGADQGLLTQLGLQEKQIVNVVMHRDIVPRAFTCDYPLHVVRLLKRLNGAFRDHPCLDQQRLLYTPVGHVMILQPDDEQSPGHPLLPSKMASLYLIKHPQEKSGMKGTTSEAAALEVRDAQRAFFNMPHPLDMLRDPGAYGFEGAISRDHDPRSYRRAINTVISQCLRKRVIRHFSTQSKPKILHVKKNFYPQFPSPRVPLTSPSSPSPSPILLPYLPPSPTPLSLSSPLRKHVLHHSSRLLSSNHTHMGILFLLSLSTNLFSSFISWV